MSQPLASISKQSSNLAENDFHGSAQIDYEGASFQSNNITPALKSQGLSLTNPIKNYSDYHFDLGGRIIKDKLWFYIGGGMQTLNQGLVGFVSAPDAAGCWLCADAPAAYVLTSLAQQNIKLSYQLKPSVKLIGVWQHSFKHVNPDSAGRLRPKPSASVTGSYINLWKAEVQASPTNHLFIDAYTGQGGYDIHVSTQPGTDVPGNPASIEESTNLVYGPADTYFYHRPNIRYQTFGSVSYLRGKHQLKAGTGYWRSLTNTQYGEHVYGDYELYILRGVPDKINTWNFPLTPQNYDSNKNFYVTDTWNLGRVSLNLGVRWELARGFYPSQ
jgi:hypothetical protein